MPLVSGLITNQGAVLTVFVGVSKARRETLKRLGMAVPDKVAVRAQLDTGSFATGFMPEVFASLRIGPIGEIAVRTPSTRRGEIFTVDQYDVSLTIPVGTDHHSIGILAIASEDFQIEDEVQAIIGRDVLNCCTLNYFGCDKKFQLGF